MFSKQLKTLLSFIVITAVLIFCSCGGNVKSEESLILTNESTTSVNEIRIKDELFLNFEKAGGKKHFFIEIVTATEYENRDTSKFWISSSVFLPSEFQKGLFSTVYPQSTIESFPTSKMHLAVNQLPTSSSGKYYIRLHYINLKDLEEDAVMDEENGVDQFASLIGKMVDAKVSNTYYLRVNTLNKVANIKINSGRFIPLTREF